jgi:23S rRNA (adenine2503-C2)-methyltransferase
MIELDHIPSHARTDDGRVNLKTMGVSDLEQFATSIDQPAYRGRQLFHWMYGKGASSFEEMTSLPKDFRKALAEEATIHSFDVETMQRGGDGTMKALFRLPSGKQAETVLIPDIDERGDARRLTVCVSSQVGCAMGCTFCATGQMGFQENIPAGAIVDQVQIMNDAALEHFDKPISNVVYMGMGEPLLNYDGVMTSVDILTHEKGMDLSPRRITVSTVGLARRIKDIADDDRRFHLAVSLHAPTNEKRSSIMPINEAEKTSLPALKEAVEYYAAKTGRPITYEYCMFDGVNDSKSDAKKLAEITRWVPSKVNLIMYNPVDGLGFGRTPEDRLDDFIQVLIQEGVTVTVRRSRGQDIDAACGQLANKG